MLIGLISDTHSLIRAEALAALHGVELILHAGDVGGDSVLRELRGIAPVHAVIGNTDDPASGLPRRVALRRAHEVLDLVGIAEERYREVQTYSTGMRQKQKLAQALVHDPCLVFLDEPTSGLDPLGRERMLRLIRSLFDRAGVSVVLSTHILRDVETVCDAVVILGSGRLLVHDRVETLRKPVAEMRCVVTNWPSGHSSASLRRTCPPPSSTRRVAHGSGTQAPSRSPDCSAASVSGLSCGVIRTSPPPAVSVW